MADFGDAVRQLMERKGVTADEPAKDMGVSSTSVSRLLNGVSKPRQHIVQRLCATSQEEQLPCINDLAGMEGGEG